MQSGFAKIRSGIKKFTGSPRGNARPDALRPSESASKNLDEDHLRRTLQAFCHSVATGLWRSGRATQSRGYLKDAEPRYRRSHAERGNERERDILRTNPRQNRAFVLKTGSQQRICELY